ncbi:hypothetical protein CCAX7_11230 [Capsulimonas corticalis]|uniref:Suppressor of fused-like domain-containing protein n=1 Tax=Capsulimonas corticalis TaxID=2219043 RepID=A0A402CUS0_9BACT|nr:suppressor of fused domain protein [Capsulimonas corticalis]BDI29072.1 hypothetical protein CCAX7_11230 [Capsulimonas corticalis]
MSVDWTEAYVDHYARFFLGAPDATHLFQLDEARPPIQILTYDRVVAGCRLFASLGFSLYAPEGCAPAEVVCPVDAGGEAVPDILANALFHIATRSEPLTLSWGSTLDGLEHVNPAFAKKYKKEALYFTDPYGFPDEFAHVLADTGGIGRMYLAMFLSKKEHAFLREHQRDAFEEKLEEKGVDPYDVRRKSCV